MSYSYSCYNLIAYKLVQSEDTIEHYLANNDLPSSYGVIHGQLLPSTLSNELLLDKRNSNAFFQGQRVKHVRVSIAHVPQIVNYTSFF